MKVQVQKVHVSRSALICGARISGPKDSWVRFAEVRIPFDLIPNEVVRALVDMTVRRQGEPHPADQHLF